jgi:hypothetical protein
LLKNFLNILFTFFLVFFSSAQEETLLNATKIKFSPLSVRIDFSVPNPTNQAWKKCMVGVVEGNLSINYKIPKTNLFTGIGYKGNLFYTPPSFFIFDLKTKMQMHGSYLKVGYDIAQNNILFISPSLNLGWCQTSYTGVVCESKTINYNPSYSSWFFEPGLNINIMPDSNFGVSASFTFVTTNNIWDPDYICMNDHVNLTGLKKDALTTYYNLGLGIYIGIGKK